MLRNLFFLIIWMSGIGLTPSCATAVMSTKIGVTLEIVDEQGRGVPYATVWRYLLPRTNPLAINAEDLFRITTRYQSSFEFAVGVSNNKPVPYLSVDPMGNESGRFHREIDYRYEEGSEAKRPEKMSIGFAIMKRGYLPAFVNFAVTNESTLSSRVVLKVDPRRVPELQPYLVNFERLRFQLSDTRLNEDISENNYQRIERLRTEFEATARQALEAGDKGAAARIYARLQYFPSIRLIRGKPAGFSQAEPASEQSIAFIEKAYALDPANPYIAAKYLFPQGTMQYGGKKYEANKANEEQRRNFSKYLSALHVLMRTYGEEIWPAYHQLYARWLLKSNDPRDRKRVVPLLEELYRVEPKFQMRDMPSPKP